MSIKLTPELVAYPNFIYFVIYNKTTRTWHAGGIKKFVSSKHISGAKKYKSYNYAENVLQHISDESDNKDLAIVRYMAKATDVY